MSLAATIEDGYVNPPGFFPIVYISGSEFEMGYQYGYQAGKYISLVKDGLWSSLLERYNKETFSISFQSMSPMWLMSFLRLITSRF
ncbi:MAG: hypothetical protein DRJ60_07485 [Thermoprotei archaeon]|nr:MAG: hypothetical protein DRJ60_07485 [Thermoprotei archaeon]